MDFSIANIAFGMIGGLFVCLFIILVNYSHLARKYKASHSTIAKLCVAVLALNFFYSLSTYGPRSNVQNTPQAEYKPAASEVRPSEEMFTKERDRLGQFDDQLEEAP